MSNDENITLCHARPSSGQNPDVPILVRSPRPTKIPKNHVLLKVDRFGFSTNNISYQALGEAPHFRYFEFHPAPTVELQGVSPQTHGVTPVWGFATVAESTHPKVGVGERVYGYLAPTRYLLLPISPSDVNKFAFYVPRPHLPADRRPYNQIQRCATDPMYDPSPSAEDYMMLYRPLFWTSFWCEDWINYARYRDGAKRVLISSASSKTAFCLAYLIGKRAKISGNPGMKVMGLTSKRNVPFTKRLGLYDEVFDYESYASAVQGAERWIYVDVASNDAFNKGLFQHFSTLADELAAAIQLGLTNLAPSSAEASSNKWTTNTFKEGGPSQAVHAATSLEQFFMPEWLAVRKKTMDIHEMTDLQIRAWKELMRDCGPWVELERIRGGEAVKRAYEQITKGGMGPDKGQIWSLWNDGEGKTIAKL